MTTHLIKVEVIVEQPNDYGSGRRIAVARTEQLVYLDLDKAAELGSVAYRLATGAAFEIEVQLRAAGAEAFPPPQDTAALSEPVNEGEPVAGDSPSPDAGSSQAPTETPEPQPWETVPDVATTPHTHPAQEA